MTHRSPGLHISNINFAFTKNQKLFFSNLSLSCSAGSITFLQGKNGIGKSTLFRIIRGAIREQEFFTGTFQLGNTTFECRNNQLPYDYQRHVKKVTQNVADMIAPACTVIQNLQLARMPQFPQLKKLPAISNTLDLLPTKDIDLDAPASQLSGGQRQLLVINMVLQTPTTVLLLDEPTAALDEQNSDLVIKAVEDAARVHNLIVIIIAHDTELVARYKQAHLLVLKETVQGKMIEVVR